MAKQPHILIVTVADDLHAGAVRSELRRRGVTCSLVETDRVSDRHRINWRLFDGELTCQLTTESYALDLHDVDIVWWRRQRGEQQLQCVLSEPKHKALVDADCRGALVGALYTGVSGQWISDPLATERAANKLVQLNAAVAAGFDVPRTLVSQDPAAVRAFWAELAGQVVAKPVVGTREAMLFTQMVTPAMLADAEAIKLCPTIYQEFVPGLRHIRLNCFGDTCHAALIQSAKLDWRPDLNVPIDVWPVPTSLGQRCRAVLSALRLEMGVFDFKITPDERIIWLEVNPQGQFLFLEGLTDFPYLSMFCDFVHRRAIESVNRRVNISSHM